MGFKVIAVEPSPYNIKILRTRFQGNINIVIVPSAISSKKGKEIFFESESDNAINTLSTKWKQIGEARTHSHKLYGKSYEVETITLDEIIKNFGIPAFIKIDVEGHEEIALKGLTRRVPLLSFEAILPDFLNETIKCVEHLRAVNSSAVFNYVVDNKLVFDSFVSKPELITSIQSLPDQTIEVICKC